MHEQREDVVSAVKLMKVVGKVAGRKAAGPALKECSDSLAQSWKIQSKAVRQKFKARRQRPVARSSMVEKRLDDGVWVVEPIAVRKRIPVVPLAPRFKPFAGGFAKRPHFGFREARQRR